jgi:hypothetical protein
MSRPGDSRKSAREKRCALQRGQLVVESSFLSHLIKRDMDLLYLADDVGLGRGMPIVIYVLHNTPLTVIFLSGHVFTWSRMDPVDFFEVEICCSE